MSEIRNQLQTLTGSAIEASQLTQVGGKVFTNAQDAQGDFMQLVSWWQAIHVPTYGQPIPGTAFTINHAGDGAVYAPGVNETGVINGLFITNGDPANPATVTLDIDGVQVHQEATVPSLSGVGVIGLTTPGFTITNGQTLTATITGATSALVSVDVCGYLVVQG